MHSFSVQHLLIIVFLGAALTSCDASPISPTARAGQRLIGVSTAVPWIRPTPRPAVDTTTELINFSNMPGGDVAPSVAVHPTDGWAAAIWANVPPDDPDDAAVFVKVQDP